MQLLGGVLVLVSIIYYYYSKQQLPKGEQMSLTKFVTNAKPFPAYFFSHGGPTFMYEDDPMGDAGAWKTIRNVGKTIKKWQPDYIIVVLAHWQSSGTNLIEINVPDTLTEENKLIYDFYNFPDHMYREEFHSLNSPNVGNAIRDHLKQQGFEAKVTRRGIDHGVWVPFKVAFSDYNTQTPQPAEKGLDLPNTKVIQVSLTSNDHDFETHYKLGQALSHFRTNNVWDEAEQRYLTGLVVCLGMLVHNLGDLRKRFAVAPYAKPFSDLVTDILTTSEPSLYLDKFRDLQKNNGTLLRQAHPTQEHFLPLVVGAGLADEGDLKTKLLYNSNVRSLAWGTYQFGEKEK